MVARQRPNGHLDPWKDAREPATMDLQPGQTGRPSTKGTICRCQRMTSGPQPPRPTEPSSRAPSSSATTDPTRRVLRSRWRSTELSPSDKIVLVHATAPASNWLGTPYYDRAVAQTHDAAERVLDEMRPIAEQVETPIEFSVLEGPPAEVLIRAAAVRDADEIVVGSRGLGRIRGALGSVSQELLREAARPVLVVSRDAAVALETPALAS